MNAEQIRDDYLAKAREEARVSGRDVEVTSLAFAQACARIAELEGAQAKDAAELERLHSFYASARTASRQGDLAVGVWLQDALEEFDRAPAQAEPQDGSKP